MFYRNRARTSHFIVRHNVFANSTEVCLRMDTDWREALTLDHNLWYQPSKPLIRFRIKQYYGAKEFGRYQKELGMDPNSARGQPRFADPAARDYRLLSSSPGAELASDGGPVGARAPEATER